MQVQVTLADTKITKVTVLQRTNNGPKSDEIDATAIPKLTSETLAAQDLQIDAVSGASYTSHGYIASLQSALDKELASSSSQAGMGVGHPQRRGLQVASAQAASRFVQCESAPGELRRGGAAVGDLTAELGRESDGRGVVD